MSSLGMKILTSLWVQFRLSSVNEVRLNVIKEGIRVKTYEYQSSLAVHLLPPRFSSSRASLSALISLTTAWMRASEIISETLPALTMQSSMFFSDSTTSSSVSIARRIVAYWFMPSVYFFSRYSRSSLDFLPIALAFHWPTAPEGSV